ncbi:MAG: tetratricopeptide repeat protein [Phycisphaerales bacterium]|nr:MAG: tetratricopeptide repeat protein [Phycisphaerales bacterium]
MCSKKLIAWILAVVPAISVAAWAQAPAELLEKGLYTEETVGDLEGAIEIYQKIVADANANRTYVAQAQLRLGICHLKNGQDDKAEEAFQKLIKDFPDQKELVAQAREQLGRGSEGFALGPVPWLDGETLPIIIKLSTGLRVGMFVWTADSTEFDGEDAWRFRIRRYVPSGQGLTTMIVDADSFALRISERKSSVLGDYEGVVRPGRVDVTARRDGNESVNSVKVDDVVYENDQFMYLTRRLPLQVGYKTSLKLFTLVTQQVIHPQLAVTAKENVTVPAGTFECFKVEFTVDAPPHPASQIFWFSTDPSRYMVKFEAGGVVGELGEIAHRQPGENVAYRNEDFGFSMAAPAGWFFFEHDSPGNDNVRRVSLLDPESEVHQAILEVLKKPAPIDYAPLAEIARDQIGGVKTFLKDYKLRKEGWTEGEISGIPAVSFVGDYRDAEERMVEYRIYLVGAQVGKAVATFVFKTSAELFDDYRDVFDNIVESYQAD